MIGFDVKRSGDGKDMRLALGSFKYRTYVGAKARNTDLQERPLCRSSSTEHRIAAAPRRRSTPPRREPTELVPSATVGGESFPKQGSVSL